MYDRMLRGSESLIIDRGLALHKLIRLLTFSLAGEGYLNFMGNEFGHPEWVDFPRPGNSYSFHYARRQWSLVDNPELRYRGLARFDAALQQLDVEYGVLEDPFIEQLLCDETAKLLVYRRGPLVFACNLHPAQSLPDLRIPVPDAADYVPILDTDRPEYEGHGRVAEGVCYPRQDAPLYGRAQSILLYLPARTGQVLAPRDRAGTR
jgi:1,4-alpha-glucan branching enzyme